MRLKVGELPQVFNEGVKLLHLHFAQVKGGGRGIRGEGFLEGRQLRQCPTGQEHQQDQQEA